MDARKHDYYEALYPAKVCMGMIVRFRILDKLPKLKYNQFVAALIEFTKMFSRMLPKEGLGIDDEKMLKRVDVQKLHLP